MIHFATRTRHFTWVEDPGPYLSKYKKCNFELQWKIKFFIMINHFKTCLTRCVFTCFCTEVIYNLKQFKIPQDTLRFQSLFKLWVRSPKGDMGKNKYIHILRLHFTTSSAWNAIACTQNTIGSHALIDSCGQDKCTESQHNRTTFLPEAWSVVLLLQVLGVSLLLLDS